MPTLLEHNGLRFFFYSNEGELQNLPKVFVQKSRAEAEFSISHDIPSAVYLHRSFGFSVVELQEIRKILEHYGRSIQHDWNNVFC